MGFTFVVKLLICLLFYKANLGFLNMNIYIFLKIGEYKEMIVL